AVVAADLLVTARAEGLSAGAGQDDHADPWVVASDVEGVAELEQCSGPEGVADVGAIDRDLGNPVDRVVPDVVVVATADPIVQVSTPRAITSMVAMVADTRQKGSLPCEVGGVPGEAGGGGPAKSGEYPAKPGEGGPAKSGEYPATPGEADSPPRSRGSTRRSRGRGSRDPGSPRSLLRGVGMLGEYPAKPGEGAERGALP